MEAALSCELLEGEQDLALFKNIKDWETEKVLKMRNQKEKAEYIEGLRDYARQLKDEFKKLSDTNRLDNKRWRFAADIEQFQWRATFLEAAIKNQAEETQGSK